MRSPSIPDRFDTFTAVALGGILTFSVLAFGSTPVWAEAVLRALILALGIAWAIRITVFRIPLKKSVLLIPLGSIVLWGGVQLALATPVYRFATWTAVLAWIGYGVLFAIALQVFSYRSLRADFLTGFLYAGFALSIFAVIHHFTSPQGSVYWVVRTASINSFGPFVDGDHYAAFVELVLPIAILEALRRQDWLHSAISGFLFASVVACLSRTGVAICLLEFIVIPLIAGMQDPRLQVKWAMAFTTVALGGFTVLFILVFGWDALWARYMENDPYRYRRELLVSSTQMFQARPLFGFGMGTFETVYPAYASFDLDRTVDHAHNDWAEWAATGGIPLLALTAWIFGWSIAAGIRCPWGLGAAAVLLHAVIDFPMQIPAIASLVLVMLAALAGASAQAHGPASTARTSRAQGEPRARQTAETHA